MPRFRCSECGREKQHTSKAARVRSRCRDCGIVSFERVDDSDDERRLPELLADHDGRPWIADCADCEVVSVWTQKEQASRSVGGHRETHDHETALYQLPGDDTRLYYPPGLSSGRNLHLDPECPVLDGTDRLTRAKASYPPRGTMCDRCAPVLTTDDLPTAVVADGGGHGA